MFIILSWPNFKSTQLEKTKSQMFKFFASKEETLLNKATKNDPSRIPKDILSKIHLVMNDPIESQQLHHEILRRLDLTLLPNEFLKLLCVVFYVLKKDTKNSFLNKIMTNDVKFITKIPEKYRSADEKELCIAFANHLDWYVTLYSTDTPAIDINISPEQISQFHSDISSERTIISLFSMFCNLTALNWENERFFVNKLFSFVIMYLIRELSTTFYRLCCYIIVYFSFMAKGQSSRSMQQIKILAKFEESQVAFEKILQSDTVKIYFSDAPSYDPVNVRRLFDLLQISSNMSQGISVSTTGTVDTKESVVESKQLEDDIRKETEIFSMQIIQKMEEFEYFTRIKSDSSTPSRVVSRSTSKTRLPPPVRYSEEEPSSRFSGSESNIVCKATPGISIPKSTKALRRISVSSCLTRSTNNDEQPFALSGDLCH
ncbi:hypothetical protein EIN_225530 [Entamoeba invadens IP1]|uniref:Uncharacterized protein n=1 Tax=Entamoeba invadens IP1 TaxID=370355 RepID=A0A0A1U5T6_ENTIV|nr:hypothetical protein EIN_225530 [Entamoeba invadens IP1]ELP88230.1 hypothetical protein EIN_225530 [Entamoeba invadens IP1]|eukprot:XP_004255001.1 hypothetical protein EIN_225530 [Entamoeba invadens IP1]